MAQTVKNLPVMWETGVVSMSRKDPLENETATHSSILAWEIPLTEELGRLQSMGLQRLRHDLLTERMNERQKTKRKKIRYVCYLEVKKNSMNFKL